MNNSGTQTNEARLPELTIRTATIDDYDAICALYTEGDTLHHTAHPEAFLPARERPRSREFIDIALSDPSSTVLFAEIGDDVAGLVRVAVRPSSTHPARLRKKVGQVEELIVFEAHQGIGAGKALMSAARGWCEEQGVNDMMLTVWEFNTDAIAFYERLGYRSLSRTMRLEDKDTRTP